MLEYLKLLSTVVLGSGAAIAIVKLFFDNKKEKRERAEAIKFLAAQLAFQFEGFAITCADGVSDHQIAVEHGGQAGGFLGSVPEPPDLQASEAYQFVDSEILNRVFGFSQLRKMAQLAASFWINVVGDNDCYQTAVEENTISMGFESLEIARSIRSRYGIGERSLTFGKWNIDKFLREEMSKVNKQLEQREAMSLDRRARAGN